MGTFFVCLPLSGTFMGISFSISKPDKGENRENADEESDKEIVTKKTRGSKFCIKNFNDV
jgi:hypothetical protein